MASCYNHRSDHFSALRRKASIYSRRKLIQKPLTVQCKDKKTNFPVFICKSNIDISYLGPSNFLEDGWKDWKGQGGRQHQGIVFRDNMTDTHMKSQLCGSLHRMCKSFSQTKPQCIGRCVCHPATSWKTFLAIERERDSVFETVTFGTQTTHQNRLQFQEKLSNRNWRKNKVISKLGGKERESWKDGK